MRILITNNHLNTIGGSETWVNTVKSVLERFLCDVDVFTFYPGDRSNKTPERPPKGEYDLILCNHNSCFDYCVKYVKYKKITFVSHGTANPLENPPFGADRYISVSKEVQEYNRKWAESEVILNPVDFAEFFPVIQPQRPVKKVLGIFQGEIAQTKVKTLRLENKFTPTDRYARKKLNLVNMNWPDLVFSLGRGAFESLACGRPVIVYDSRGYMSKDFYDGLITEENIETFLSCNCSGRATRQWFTTEKVMEEISQVQESGYYRALAEKYFDADKICKQLIQ
jgi:glycosyltransferase involved in cell wall biosynthesis